MNYCEYIVAFTTGLTEEEENQAMDDGCAVFPMATKIACGAPATVKFRGQHLCEKHADWEQELCNRETTPQDQVEEF